MDSGNGLDFSYLNENVTRLKLLRIKVINMGTCLTPIEVEGFHHMNVAYTDQADTGYRLAEQKAAQYFASLYVQVKEKTYVPILTEDILMWKRKHVRRDSWLSFFPRERENLIPGTIIDISGGSIIQVNWMATWIEAFPIFI